MTQYPRWLLIAWALAAATLPWMLEPSFAWRDGPEFVTSSWVLGIAHPAGYPLYQALAWMAEQFPFGDILIRNHAFSAILNLAAAVILYHAAMAFMRLCWSENKPIHTHLAGWLSLCWLLMPSQLENAVQSEAYSLFAVFSFLVCKLLLEFQHSRDPRYYLLAVFLAGLGCGNQIMLGTFIFAFIIVLSIYTDVYTALITGLKGAVAGIFGLLVYLYLPVRSLQDPSFDWGNPETFERFWRHVSDKKDASSHFIGYHESGSALDPVITQMSALSDNIGWLGIIAIVIGWIWLIVHRPRLSLIHLSWSGFLMIFFMGWVSGTVLTGAYGMLSVGILPILLGLYYLPGRLALAGKVLAACLAGGIFLNIYLAGIAFLAKRSDYLPSELVRMELLKLPYRATALTGLSWFQARGLADIEGIRPDVTVIGLGDIVSPQYFRPLRPQHIPLLHYPDFSVPAAGTPPQDQTIAFINQLRSKNDNNTVFFVDMDESFQPVFMNYLAPEDGHWWPPLSPRHAKNNCEEIQRSFIQSVSAMLAERGALIDHEFNDFLQNGYFAWVNVANLRTPYCANTAKAMLRWWRVWVGNDIALQPGAFENAMGIVFMRQGYDRGAKIMFQLSASVGNSDGVGNLGIWYAQHGDIKKGVELLKNNFLANGYDESFQKYRKLIHRNPKAP